MPTPAVILESSDGLPSYRSGYTAGYHRLPNRSFLYTPDEAATYRQGYKAGAVDRAWKDRQDRQRPQAHAG